MIPKTTTLNRLKALFQDQKLTTLATQEQDHPYLSLMAFIVSDDLKVLIVATKRGTRKYSNMIRSPGVAFLIDNRRNQEADFKDALAVTGIGRAIECLNSEKESLLGRFLARHPDLAGFLKDPECALMKIEIGKYTLVSQFQEVEELAITT